MFETAGVWNWWRIILFPFRVMNMVKLFKKAFSKFPLDIKIACYLDVKVPFTKLKRRRWWIDWKQKGNGKHINHRKPRTIKGRRKHKMERKEMVKMWEARHYKARLEAMASLKMSGCVPPLAMQDKA